MQMLVISIYKYAAVQFLINGSKFVFTQQRGKRHII